MGVTTVRDSTIPLAVTHPGGSPIVVNPSDAANLHSIVANAGTGATFWFTKGLYNVVGVSGAGNRIAMRALQGQRFYFESAAGYSRTSSDSVVLDAGGATLSCILWSQSPAGVVQGEITVKGGVWTGIGGPGPANDFGAAISILEGAPGSLAGGSLVEDVIVHDNHVKGVAAGPGPMGLTVMRRVYTYLNGINGLGGRCADATQSDGILVESCRVHDNSQRTFLPSTDPDYINTGGTGSESKFFVNNSTFNMNWFHDGVGFGLWNDWKHYNCTYSNNVIENEDLAGLFLEMHWGGSYVHHNYFKNNGQGVKGIPNNSFQLGFNSGNLLLTGPDAYDPASVGLADNNEIDVAWNDFDNYGSGDPSYQPPKGEYLFKGPHPWGVQVSVYNRSVTTRRARGVKIHNNRFWVRGAGPCTGMVVQDIGANATLALNWTDPTNEWYENQYHVQDLANKNWCFAGAADNVESKDWASWQAVLNHDTAYGGHSVSTRELI
jgi:hypothetical protein